MLLPVGEKRLCWAVLGSLTMTCVVVPPLPVILTDDVSQKVWLSLISTYHGGAYPQQDPLSFLASRGKRTNLS